MATAADIPPELWIHISQFIPDAQLRDMLQVNRCFYDLALNLRYNNVSIEDCKPRSARMLERLMDPAIARRVRHLTIHPYLTSVVSTFLKDSSLFQRALTLLSAANPSEAPPPSPEDIRASLLAVLPGLVNLTHWGIRAWDLPPGYDVRAFLAAAFEILAPRLRTLFIAGHLDVLRMISQIPTALFSLVELAELTLELTNNPFRTYSSYSSTAVTESDTLANTIAPFLNTLTHLTTLNITSWALADLSPLFARLDVFPRLRRFALRMPFNKAFRLGTGGEGGGRVEEGGRRVGWALTRFLSKHSEQLHECTLRLNPTGAAIDPVNSEQGLAQWLTDITAGTSTTTTSTTHTSTTSTTLTTHTPSTPSTGLTTTDGSPAPAQCAFTSLRALTIYPTSLPAGFAALLALAAQCRDTLGSLAVRDRYLTFREIEALLRANSSRSNSSFGEISNSSEFRGKSSELRGNSSELQANPSVRPSPSPWPALRTLRLNVRELSIEVFDLLADTVPGVRSVWLFVGDAVPGGEARRITLHVDLSTRSYASTHPTWAMHDIGLWQGGARMGGETMRAVARAVPSVQSFWGEGGMQGDDRVVLDSPAG